MPGTAALSSMSNLPSGPDLSQTRSVCRWPSRTGPVFRRTGRAADGGADTRDRDDGPMHGEREESFGEVYKARDSRLDRIVAIKKDLGPFSERFEREARAMAKLNHPRICSLCDVGPDYLCRVPLKCPFSLHRN